MYEPFFALSRRPFSVHPDPSAFFPLPAHQQIVAALRDCVEHVTGIGLLVGETGLGKTLLCRVLIQELSPVLQGVLLTHSNLPSKRALLQAILFELRQPYLGMDEQESRLALMNFLQSRAASDPSLLLVVDEAHGLQRELLEELRLLTNWISGNKPLIRLVLAGQPLLEEQLTGAETDLLNQRIARRAYLWPLSEEETARYVDFRLRWAGAETERIFTAEALEAIHRATEGAPRSINLLCDQALLLAAARRMAPVTAAVVKEAWGELQQLPVQWGNAGTAPGAPADESSNVVEFGSPEVPFGGLEAEDTSRADLLESYEEFDDVSPAEFGGAGDPGEPHYAGADDSDLFDAPDRIGEVGSTAQTPEIDPSGKGALSPVGLFEPLRDQGDACGCAAVEQDTCEAAWHLGASGGESPDGQGFAPFPVTLAEDEWEIDPSPLDARFEQEEQVWDQYAVLDAQIPPTADPALIPSLGISKPRVTHGAGNGKAESARDRPSRALKSVAAPPPASPDYRRLFSTLRK